MPIEYSFAQFGQVSRELCPLEKDGLFLEEPFGTERLFILGFMHLAPKDFAFGGAFRY